MTLDYWENHKSLFEKIKDSAPVFGDVKREIRSLCNDYGVFCEYQLNNTCKGYVGTNNCPAHSEGKTAYDMNGKERRFH